MTTTIAAADALLLTLGIGAAVALTTAVEGRLVQRLLEVVVGWLIGALPVGWFIGQLYIAVEILHRLSESSLVIHASDKWDSVFSAVLLLASLAQFFISFPSMPEDLGRISDENPIVGPIIAWCVGILAIGSMLASAGAFAAGLVFLTSNAHQPVRFCFRLTPSQPCDVLGFH